MTTTIDRTASCRCGCHDFLDPRYGHCATCRPESARQVAFAPVTRLALARRLPAKDLTRAA